MLVDDLNLFYEEPDPDRWFPFDRYPRRIIRRLVRGPFRPGGQTRVFLNLCAGLDQLDIPYRVNDYRHAQGHPDELACIIGKPFVLDKIKWRNPILFGASVFSHPLADPALLERLPVKRVLVPGEWMRKMFEPYYGDRVISWPVGIDTEQWCPSGEAEKCIDVLIYDKIRWEHSKFEGSLIGPIRQRLAREGLKISEIRYGYYHEEEFRVLLEKSQAMIFLCEHESQGIAYQQALSMNVPIFAWDRGGEWQDPAFYPHSVRFAPVSSVPYWDQSCGSKFASSREFDLGWYNFWESATTGRFQPRGYIISHLSLKRCAEHYVNLVKSVFS